MAFEPRPLIRWPLAGGRWLELGPRTRVMAILNITPDSFSDGGRLLTPEQVMARGDALVAEGADLLDIGGESTRPGSAPVSEAEELARVLPVIRALEPLGLPISIDTRNAAVARQAVEAGAVIINDVSGLRHDPAMAATAAALGAGLVLMHSRATPRDMQADPRYDDLTGEVTAELLAACRVAEAAGVAPERIVLDPGLGFAKTADHNLGLLQNLPELARALGKPLLVGASRKSFIGRVLELGVDDRLEGSLAVAVAAALGGAQIVRAHDVRATVRAVRMADAIRAGKVT